MGKRVKSREPKSIKLMRVILKEWDEHGEIPLLEALTLMNQIENESITIKLTGTRKLPSFFAKKLDIMRALEEIK